MPFFLYAQKNKDPGSRTICAGANMRGGEMPRKPDERISQAKALYLKGTKLVEIAEQLKLPEGTVRRWKSTHEWDSERSEKKSERSEKKKALKSDAIQEEVEQVLENPELTDKQRLFCCLYVKSFNATKAYQKAYGSSYATALTNGPKLLGNTRIKNEIIKLKKNRLNQEMLDEYDVFQKYMDIAFADITDYVMFGREMVPVMGAFGPVKVEDEKTGRKIELKKEVNVVKFRESAEVDGTIISEVRQGKDGASIKLADRMKALQWLADHMNLATEEQRVRIAAMRSKAQMDDNEEIGDDGFLEALNGSAAEDWADEEK